MKFLTRNYISAEVQTRSADDNTIEVVWSTGSRGLRSNRGASYFEELDMSEDACDLTRLKNSAPFLRDHEPKIDSTLGVVTQARIEGGVGFATIKLSSNPAVAGVISDIQAGIHRNISVGYSVSEIKEVGTERSLPVIRATKWQPVEISLVAVPFDGSAQILRSEDGIEEIELTLSTEHTQESEEVSETIEQFQSEEQQNPEEIQEATPTEVIEVDEEQTRKADITGMCVAAGLTPEQTEYILTRTSTIEEASTEIFKQLETKNAQTEQLKETRQMTKKQMAIEALAKRANVKTQTTEGNELLGKSVLEIFEAIVERKQGEADQNYAKRAITSSDLADILVSASQKVMNEAAPAQPGYQKWTKAMTLRDFKATPIVHLGNYSLSTPTEGADYSEASLVDSKETITLRQRGIVLNLSMKAIINDDLGVLSQLPEMADQVGFNDLESAVYGVINSNPTMSDSVAFFHADHDNLIIDATGVDEASLARAEELLASQTKDGKELELKPKFIVVAPKYAYAARKLVNQGFGAYNPFADQGIEVVVSNKLTDKESWYVVADPAQCAAIVTGTLDGMEKPTVTSEEHFSSSNMKMKCEFHNTAAAANYQAIVKLTIDTTP